VTGSVRHPLFRVRHDGTGFVADDRPFDAGAYSRFKYGSEREAAGYGTRLAALLLDVHPALPEHERDVVLASAAYKHTPSAAHAAFRALHAGLLDLGVFVPVTRIRRENVVEGDYGTLGAADRERLMRENGLSVDRAAVRGKHVVVLDDVRITGSHERSIDRLMATVSPASVTFLYLLELDAGQAAADPTFEDRLNHQQVRDLPSYGALLDGEPCVLNARSVKAVLDPRHRPGLDEFLRGRPRVWVEGLVRCAGNDGYDRMPTYRPSFHAVRDFLARAGTVR
jgi:hypothetical protein